MRRLLKWVLVVIVTLAVLLVGLSLVLPLILDPNDYKDRISEAVRQETGRELAIHGDIEWRVFPGLGLEINDVSLGNRAGFGERPMLAVEEATVSVALWPLLHRQVVIRSVALDGVDAYLRENTDGRNNWQDLDAAYRDGGEAGEGAAAALEIEISAGDIELRGISRNLEFEDFKAPPAVSAGGQAFELEGDLTLSIPQLAIAGELGYTGFVQADAAGRLFVLEDLELVFDGLVGAGSEAMDLELKAATDAVFDLANDRARFSAFSLDVFDLAFNGALEITSLSGAGALDGAVQLAEFSPKSLLASMGMGALETRNPGALTRMQAQALLGGSLGAVRLSELVMVLDESTLTGDLLVSSFAPLEMDFDLQLDTLNLDDYAVLAEEGAADEEVAAEGAGLLVGSMLFFTGEGNLAIASLAMLGLHAQDVNLGLNSGGNEIRLFPISSSLYGGQHQGDVRVVLGPQWPELTANQTVTNLDVTAFMRDLAGSDRLHGKADVYFEVRSQLGSAEMARRTLSGDVGFSMFDGVIDGVDILGAVRRLRALLGRPAPEPESPQQENLEFAEIIATGVIERGVLSSDDLVVRAPQVQATGRGTVDFVSETIDFLIEPVPVNELAQQLPEEYRGVPIPLRVSGSLSEPTVGFDLVGGIAAAQKAQLFEKAGDAAGKLLDGLFGKKDDKDDKDKEE